MEWESWKGKSVFVQLKSGGYYSGKVIDVDSSAKPIIFVSIIDKFNNKVTFTISEIIKIVEEENEEH